MSIGTPRRSSSGNRVAALPATPTEWARRSRLRPYGHIDRLVQRVRHLVQVPGLDPAPQSGRIDVDDQAGAAVHGDRERLCTAHAAAAGGQRERAGEGVVEAFGRDGGEGLVGALQDALGADVDRRPGGHLAVHGQAQRLQPAELGPGGPVADQVGVGQQHPGCPFVGAEHGDRSTGLHEHGLVGLQGGQRPYQRVVRGPVPGGLTGAAVDDEILRSFRHVGVEIVHQHAQGGLLRPPLRGQRTAPRGADGLHGCLP